MLWKAEEIIWLIYILNINTKGEAHHFACFADVLYICVYCL